MLSFRTTLLVPRIVQVEEEFWKKIFFPFLRKERESTKSRTRQIPASIVDTKSRVCHATHNSQGLFILILCTLSLPSSWVPFSIFLIWLWYRNDNFFWPRIKVHRFIEKTKLFFKKQFFTVPHLNEKVEGVFAIKRRQVFSLVALDDILYYHLTFIQPYHQNAFKGSVVVDVRLKMKRSWWKKRQIEAKSRNPFSKIYFKIKKLKK